MDRPIVSRQENGTASRGTPEGLARRGRGVPTEVAGPGRAPHPPRRRGGSGNWPRRLPARRLLARLACTWALGQGLGRRLITRMSARASPRALGRRLVARTSARASPRTLTRRLAARGPAPAPAPASARTPALASTRTRTRPRVWTRTRTRARARARSLALLPALGAALVLVAGCVGTAERGGARVDPPAPAKPLAQRPKEVVPYWVNPSGNAARQLAAYHAAGRTDEAELIERIARQPVAEWIGVEDPEGRARRFTEAAAAVGREALLVLYNIPHRDCGQYSKGGAPDGRTYRRWLERVAAGIGDRPATVILEPDALPHVEDGCTPRKFHAERFTLLAEAVHRLRKLPRVKVYLDAGNPHWITDVRRMAETLKRAGIEAADGFALNIANYQTTRENTEYGERLSALLGGKHFVIDTSRNGRGPAPGADDPQAWCNPGERALGEPPTTHTGHERVDAYLWVKRPGESDGPCKGGPPAGAWWPEYALDLARNAPRTPPPGAAGTDRSPRRP